MCLLGRTVLVLGLVPCLSQLVEAEEVDLGVREETREADRNKDGRTDRRVTVVYRGQKKVLNLVWGDRDADGKFENFDQFIYVAGKLAYWESFSFFEDRVFSSRDYRPEPGVSISETGPCEGGVYYLVVERDGKFVEAFKRTKDSRLNPLTEKELAGWPQGKGFGALREALDNWVKQKAHKKPSDR